MSYRNLDCPNCGRHRVELDGVCEKCEWDVDGGNYLSVTRPDEWERRHFSSADHWEGVFGGPGESEAQSPGPSSHPRRRH